MFKIINFLILATMANTVFAINANDFRLPQRDPTNSYYINKEWTVSTTDKAMLGYDPATKNPFNVFLGPQLYFDSNNYLIVDVDWSEISNKPGNLLYDTDIPDIISEAMIGKNISRFVNDVGYITASSLAVQQKVDKIIGKGLSTEDFSSAEKNKLAGIAIGATANDTDENLKNRANHTGTQSADTIVDGSNNKVFSASDKTKLDSINAYNPTIYENVSRSLDSDYTISSNYTTRVYYSIRISWSTSDLLSTSSSVFLEYSTDSGANWITVSQVSKNINSGLIQSGEDDLNVNGEIPANALVRLRTTSTNSTITYLTGQEVY